VRVIALKKWTVNAQASAADAILSLEAWRQRARSRPGAAASRGSIWWAFVEPRAFELTYSYLRFPIHIRGTVREDLGVGTLITIAVGLDLVSTILGSLIVGLLAVGAIMTPSLFGALVAAVTLLFVVVAASGAWVGAAHLVSEELIPALCTTSHS
jgi:hypothetical protein